MKNPTYVKIILCVLLAMLCHTGIAQNYQPFTPRFDADTKGDILLIGNNIINRDTNSKDPNDPYNGTQNYNSDYDMQYIDIDSDPTTFSSSNANLEAPGSCYSILYAGLYWGAIYQESDRSPINQIKLKLPEGGYNDITGEIIYDAENTPIGSNGSKPYACYADVTSMIQGLTDPAGTYTVANMTSSLGYHGGTGLCGGWSLFVVYEDPALPGKAIVSFDGFSAIGGATTLDVPVSGFRTIPIGPVRAKFAFSALEGDYRISGDYLRINGNTMNTPERPNNNFFNSKITNLAGEFTNRTPNSGNTLGFDAGILDIPNPGNNVIANGDTAATIRLGSTQDVYFYYFNAFAVDIIQPNINLTKNVENTAGVNINNGDVTLGQELDYVLTFENIGNDDAINYTITDVLPINVNLLDVDLTGAPGVTYTYDAIAHALAFTIPENLIEEGDPSYEIRIHVKVIEDCNQLRDACSNVIQNQAYQTYSSETAGNVVADQDPSVSEIDICGFPTPGSTNFLVNVDGCTFVRDEVLCGSSIQLTAGDGYTTYQWYQGDENTGTPIGNTQTITVTQPGVYTSVNTAPQPCVSIVETVNVVLFGADLPNPITPYANQVVTCPTNGELLPEIFLCGAGDELLLETHITDATSITWELLDETSCSESAENCPNTNATCTWNEVGTGASYNVSTAGQYQLTIMYQNGCFRKFYFNVYQNLFTPTEIHRDIICSTDGEITINGVPAGYEYSISGVGGPYQTSNVFPITVAGDYTVHIRPIGVNNPCIFTIINIPIRDRDFTVDVIANQPLCAGDQGSITIQMNDVTPQYYYELLQGGTIINSVGPIAESDYTFPNLNAGTYTINATTDSGCTYTETTTLVEPDPLTVNTNITQAITCSDGEFTIVANGGTPPYYYYINSTTDFQTVPEYTVTAPGIYDITVIDFNNCSVTTQITMEALNEPSFNVTNTDILCYGESSAEINFNVTDSNGYTILFSVDNGVTFSSNPLFSNLSAGTYETVVQYSLNGENCLSTPQTVTITQPAEAVTASGGVSELAGCGPAGEGRVRITNPQGGIPPYQYSFDNGSTYNSSNEAYLQPGTYTLYIQDSNGCVFPMEVTIDPAPTPPTIDIGNTEFNCDGTGNATVTVNNNGGDFDYTYILDGVENTNVPDNVFVNVPSGDHTITVQYENRTIPTYSNLLFEDFGEGGNTTTPGIASAYCFHDQTIFPSLCSPTNNPRLEDNQYAVTSAIVPNNPAWHPYRDHTSNGTNPNGRFLAINIGSAAGPNGILYSKPIENVLPNQEILVDLYLANLLRVGVGGADPDFILELVDTSGNVIASEATGIVDNTVDDWQLKSVSLNPGNTTSLTFQIRSGSIVYGGNDAAIDDINVYQIPIVCISEVEFPIVIDSNQAFSAQVLNATDVTCSGASDGQFTIAAENFELPYGFDYSLDGGTTWINSTTSPVIVTGLASATYDIDIRYDDSASTCSFDFVQEISEPTALIASASISTPATCLTGASIEATATNGTPNYQFQLEDEFGTIIYPFQTSGNFNNIPTGNYMVVVQDANGCQDPIDTLINIIAPTAPIASIDTTSDICYDTNNLATIVVSVTNGTPPFSYSLNGGAYQSSSTFTNLTPGNYTIDVRDASGCEAITISQNIENELVSNAILTKNLDCSASPDAQILVTIAGGLAPYTYDVSYNAAPFSGNITVTGNAFIYNTDSDGDYAFLITDALRCTVETSMTTINALPVLNTPTVTVTQNNLCFGDTNGALTVTPSGGLPPYDITVENTTTGTDYNSQTTGLEAGNYTITITDANACVVIANTTISQPDPISYNVTKVDITCDSSGGTSTGTITIDGVTGGTPEYTYYISNNFGYTDSYTTTASGESHVFTIINYGIYTVEVIDANGCSVITENVTIASPPNNLIIDISALTADCSTGGTAVITVTPIVSSGNYQFAVLEYNTPPYSDNYQNADSGTPEVSTFTGLTPGVTYTFVVHDMTNDCYYFETATGPISSLSNLTVSLDEINNVNCTGQADGNISFTIDNYDTGATGVYYEIFNYQSNTTTSLSGTISPLSGAAMSVNNIGNLAPGQYYILLSEIGGSYDACSVASIDFNITESTNLTSISANLTANDTCELNAGIITATGQFGTPPYEFQLNNAGDAAPTATTWTGASNNTFQVEGGNYDVYIKDAYGCIQMTSIFVPTDTPPEFNVTLDTAAICNDEGNFSMIITRDNSVGVGPFTYSINGSAFNTYTEDASYSFTVTGLNSGTQTVIIKDANGCTTTETLDILPPLTGSSTTSLSANPDCGTSDGIITVNANGGSGNYTYTIVPAEVGIVLTGNTFENVPAGDYTITVTDTTTLCTFSIPTTLETPNLPSINLVATHVTCNGDSNGTIVVNLTGSNTDPNYTFEITAPIVVAPQANNTFTNLPAGTYTVVVTSGRGCITTETVTITEPNAISVLAATVINFACTTNTNSVNNATITVNGVTGGSGTFINYEFIQSGITLQAGSNNVFTETNLVGGLYTINVYDDNGCMGSTTATINPYSELLSPTITVDSPIDCITDETITINANFNGATPTNLSYSVIGLNGNTYNSTQTSATFSGLGIGNYQILVENLDTGCLVEDVHYVTDPNTFEVTATVLSNVTCFGADNGSVELLFIDQNTTPTDDAGAFDYIIMDSNGITINSGNSPDAGPLTVNGLPSGVYTVDATLTNSPFCPTTINFTITEPASALSLDVTSTAITCISTADDGTISASGSLGWGAPYEYQLELGATVISAWSDVDTFTNLTVGTYTISIRDANGCVVSTTETLATPTPISGTLTASTTTLLCLNDANATLTVSGVTGGSGSDYLYTLVNNTTGATSGPQSNPIFTDIAAGTYHVIISDSWTCTGTTNPVTITEPNDVALGTVTVINTATCSNDATIHIEATGGTPPYTFSTDGVTFVPLDPTNSFDVVPGTYQYYIQDANGCNATLTNEVTIDPVIPVVVNLDLSGTTINCSGGTNATIVALATNGLGSYTYELVDTDTNTTVQGPQTAGTFSGVAAGNYEVLVYSGVDCTGTSQAISIIDPNPLVVNTTKNDISCFGLTDGSITVNASGGTGIIQYAISPNLNQFHDSNVFNNLSAGTYDVIAQDQNGCFQTFEIEIIEPNPLQATLGPISNELCLNDANGSITFDITGGSGTYLVSLDNTNFIPVTGNQYTFTNLSGNTFYQIYIVDSNNCYVNPPLEYYMPQAVTVIPTVDIQTTCNSNTPGNIVTIGVNADVLGAVSYSLDNITFNANNVYTDLAAGNYTAYVQHTNGCTQTVDFTIDALLPITASAATTSNVLCFGEASGQITITATGGTGTIEYAISPDYNFQAGNVFDNLTAGTYTVLVRDSITCEVSINNILVDEPSAALSVTVSGTPETCLNETDGSITINVTGGTPPYFTSLDGINFTQDVFNFNNLNGGQTYTVYVQDDNGCNITPVTFTIDEGVEIQGSVSITDTCSANTIGNNVSVSVNPTLVNDVLYSLDNINYDTINTFTDLVPGNYTVYIQHINGCTEPINFTIDNLTPITASAIATTNVLCFGDASGEITVTASGGTGTLEYAISPDYNFQTNNVFSNLSVGTYDVLVKDSITCEVNITNILVSGPTSVLTATVSGTPETCLNVSDGALTVSISGGTAPYFTSLDGSNYTQDAFNFTNLDGGVTYTVYVRDANGCDITPITYSIDNGMDIQATISVSDICLNNVSSNEVTVSVNSALTNDVQFSTDGISYISSNVFTGLANGNHTIYVQHINGCIDTVDFTINNLPPVTLTTSATNVLCNGDSSGSISVIASGGSNNLTYAISPNFVQTTSNVFNNLTAGNYTIRVYDTTGCYVEEDVAVSEPNALQATLVTVYEELCIDDNNGAIEIDIPSGAGTPPYFTSLNTETNYIQDQYIFDNLDGGETYTVYVKDANGCKTTLEVSLQEPTFIDANAEVTYLCEDNRVEITVDATVSNNVTYFLDGGAGQTTNIYSGLSAGQHEVEIMHNTSGCLETVSFFIETVIPLGLTVEETDINQITATASGGAGGYTYYFNGTDNGSDNIYTYYQSGTITILVIDANGCEIERQIPVTFVNIEIPNVFTPDGNGENDEWSPTNTNNYPDIRTLIYDRHGRVVANLRAGQAWNGEYEGNPLPTGDYWYIIKLGNPEDDREFVGHFTLYR
ncbi:T9SS type B sorting domain-containing protein [Bizionia sp. KMM 8389]